MAKLIISRHQESDWNKKGLWTGIRDRHLTEYGFSKAAEMGAIIKDIRIDKAFASMQVRTIETLACILDSLELYKIPTVHSSCLNERDYGDYTGKNKWEMEKLIGHEQWESVRRDWDCPVPQGETLKMVYERVIPFFEDTILPLLKNNENVLVISHGNSIRALIKYLEHISDSEIKNVEMLFGEILIYDIDNNGVVTHKETRQIESIVHA